MAEPGYRNEIWKTIPFAPDYEASSLGRIRRVAGGRWVGPRLIALCRRKNGRGYFHWTVRQRGYRGTATAHRAVCWAFHGAPPTTRHQVAHLDGDRGNNRPDNLRWATPKENQADRRQHGTHAGGEGNGRAKVTSEQVAAIRKAYDAGGTTQAALAAKYGIGRTQVSNILLGYHWPNV